MTSDPNLGAAVPDLLHGGFIGGIAIAVIGLFRWMMGMAIGTTRAKIEQLELERVEDRRLRDEDRKLLMAIAQALYDVMGALEHHDAAAPALERARTVLTKAFPVNAPEHLI
jgi:hypothetical protein